jgi:hypothetical protein
VKTMMTLPELSAEIMRVSEAKVDYLGDTRRMGFYAASDGRALTLDDVEVESPFMLLPHAESQVASRLGIPKKFWDRLAVDYPGELQTVARAILYQEPEERLIRTLDGKVRAFLSNRYRRIDNAAIAEQAILPTLAEFPSIEIRSAALTETRMYVKATFPNVEAEVRVGETLRSGLAISNSEVGAGRFLVELFVEKLACTNGMIATTSLSKQHTGSRLTGDDEGGVFSDETLEAADRALMLEARDLIRAGADQAQFEALIASCKELAEIEVEETPPKVIERLADRHGLSEGEGESILKHLIEGGDLSAWGYVNAVTRTAEDADSYDRATELERLGGKLVALPAQDWRFN